MSWIHRAGALLLTLAVASAGGCERGFAPLLSTPGASSPAQAVTVLVADLRRNDLASYAEHAIPPELHDQIETAWEQGRTLFPLTELPLDDRLPGFMTALAAPGAERKLRKAYDQQFAGAHAELRSAAVTLGLFATQYVRLEGDYSEPTRDHYAQVVAAFGDWGRRAPLGERKRAHAAIPQLVAAARTTGLGRPDAFRKAGMTRSLRRLGPFFARCKYVLRDYGLDLDATLAHAEASLLEQTGATARVRLRYTLAGRPVDAVVPVERIDGRWYLSDLVRHARAELEPKAIVVAR